MPTQQFLVGAFVFGAGLVVGWFMHGKCNPAPVGSGEATVADEAAFGRLVQKIETIQ